MCAKRCRFEVEGETWINMKHFKNFFSKNSINLFTLINNTYLIIKEMYIKEIVQILYKYHIES